MRGGLSAEAWLARALGEALVGVFSFMCEPLLRSLELPDCTAPICDRFACPFSIFSTLITGCI